MSNGTLNDGAFSLDTENGTIRIPQVDETCNAEGLYSFALTVAPSVAGTYATSIFIDSNDPDEGRIEIPVQVRFTDVVQPGMDPDIEVSAGHVTGPIVGDECANGVCILNGGLPIALSDTAPTQESNSVAPWRCRPRQTGPPST